MKKVIFVCDLCGWQMAEPYVMIQVEDREAGERHICQICAERIREALPKPEATKEEEPKEEKPKPEATKEEEPKEEKPKRKRIDQGKVLALAKAGWSAQKIADEMGCSVPAVYNALKKEAE